MLQGNLVTGATSTPEAQCLREFEADYAVECHHGGESFSACRAKAFSRCHLQPAAKQEGKGAQQVVSSTMQPQSHTSLPNAFLKLLNVIVGYVLRYYNMSQEKNVRVSEKQQTILDLLNAHIQFIQD